MTEPAFETLVRRYHAAVYATARRILRDPDDAEDVTQQAFLHALPEADAIAEQEEPARRLCWLASRLALSHLRGERNRRRREETHSMNRESEHRDDRPEDREQRRLVRRALDGLPDELRLPLVLRYQEDMTLAAAAGVLACAESTIHDRLRRGVERLRQRLSSAGLAPSAAAVPGLLAASREVAVPALLESKLLALCAGAHQLAGVASTGVSSTGVSSTGVSSTGVSSTGVSSTGAASIGSAGAGLPTAGRLGRAAILLIPAVAVVLGVTGLWPDGESPRPSAGVTADAPSRPGSPPAATTDRQAPQDPVRAEIPVSRSAPPAQRATRARLVELRGEVRDREQRPLGDALVTATTLAFWGKAPVFARTTRSAADGSFTLQLPVDLESGLRYRVQARLEEYVAAIGEPFLVQPGGRLDPVALTLQRRQANAPGRYQVDVVVRSTRGEPIAKAGVKLFGYRPDREPWADAEASAATDADGRCRLSGDSLGDKELVVDARWVGGRRVSKVFPVRGGLLQKTVEMPPALTVTGIVRDTDGRPVPLFDLTAYRGENHFDGKSAVTGADGRFTLDGLDEGPYSLHGRQNDESRTHWSPFDLHGVEAGSRNLLLTVKRRSDPRDHGLHDGEIHGRVIEDTTGGPLRVSVFQLHTAPVSGADPRTEAENLHANLVHPRPVQTAYSGQVPDPSADFHEVGLAAGTYVVYATLPDRAVAMSTPIRLASGQIVTGVTLRVDDGATLRGVVRNTEGRPQPGAILFLTGRDEPARRTTADLDGVVSEPGDRRLSLPGGAVRADAAGRFEIRRIPSRLPVVLVVLHESFLPLRTEPLVLHPGESREGLDLRFDRRR